MRSYLMRVGAVPAMAAMLVVLPMCMRDSRETSSNSNVARDDEAAIRAALAATPMGHVVSRDAEGRARTIAGSSDASLSLAAKSDAVARAHLVRHASVLGLDEAAVRDARVTATHSFGGGASIVQFGQQVDGVPVFHARASVAVDARGQLVRMTSNLHPRRGDGARFSMPSEAALAAAMTAEFGTARPRVLESTVKRVWFPQGNDLVAAHHVEFLVRADGSNVNQGYGYVVADTKPRVLYRTLLTHNEAFQYRVWAEAGGDHVPMDGPHNDFSPHATGVPDETQLGYQSQNLVTMEGFNKNPQGKADPWLPADAKVTFGNNVHAYSDRSDTHSGQGGDGMEPGVDLEADLTGPRAFDRAYDVTKEPNVGPDQIKAAVTQLFYVTNWLHDYWYDSGFNEAAGVAQKSNYGRGGVEGDPMRVEAQDGADHEIMNNANMYTPEDGTSPRMQMFVFSGEPVNRDGSLDNTIVAHEWGHYLHQRLVSCSVAPADPEFPRFVVGSCAGMSEGWADFSALFMVLRESDPLDGAVYPLSQYAAASFSSNSAYFGIRRAPYSTDLKVNPFTFQHVRKGSQLPKGAPILPTARPHEAHCVGEVWAQMLFDAYVNVLEAGKAATPPRTFQQSKRRMADYVVAGMKMTPSEPTFTEQRDAVLAAAWAAGSKDDFNALARGFAKRGLGVGAISPPSMSSTLDEAKESFSGGGELALANVTIDDSVSSCDRDGVLDAGESGLVTIDVRNAGWEKLAGTRVRITTSDGNVTFGNGGEASIESLDVLGSAKISIPMTAKAAMAKSIVPIEIALANPAAHTQNGVTTIRTLVHVDDAAGSAATDTVESAAPSWTFAHGGAKLESWSRQGDAQNHIWHGNDAGRSGDESMVSPGLVVGSDDFTVAFRHRFQFEAAPAMPGGPDLYWDGGVLEISADNGATWKDVATVADPGYVRTLHAAIDSENVLKGRKAWAGTSKGYPDFVPVSVNLGKAFAGQTVKIRFRIGTDQGSGATGWDIDDVAFGGITNKPFGALIDNRTGCGADAGAPVKADASAGPGASPSGGGDGGGGCSISAGSSSTAFGGAFGLLMVLAIRRRRARR